MTADYQPLILIGAARSGTKLLRDLVASHPFVDKVPYDINYVWRLGNESISHDALGSDVLTGEAKQRIVQQMARFHSGAPFLIEKSVSNCLRVPFVSAVYPNALFLHLVRDGYDVVESAYRQWLAPPDWKYLFQKARTFPMAQAPGYAVDYAFSLIRKAMGNQGKAAATWGPRYAGIVEDLNRYDLLEVCAIQWSRCVLRAVEGLEAVEASRVITIRYEDFVSQPLVYLSRVAAFLDIEPDAYRGILKQKPVTRENVGKGRRKLTEEQVDLIAPHLEEGMTLLDYA